MHIKETCDFSGGLICAAHTLLVLPCMLALLQLFPMLTTKALLWQPPTAHSLTPQLWPSSSFLSRCQNPPCFVLHRDTENGWICKLKLTDGHLSTTVVVSVLRFSVKLECLLSHCIIAPMLALDPALPANVSLKELPTLAPSLVAAKELLLMSKPSHPSTTASVVVFHSQADGKYTHTRTQRKEKKRTLAG